MSYCRFENTYHDLEDCEEKLMEYDSLDEILEDDDISDSEKRFIKRLINLCKNISDSFEGDV